VLIAITVIVFLVALLIWPSIERPVVRGLRRM